MFYLLYLFNNAKFCIFQLCCSIPCIHFLIFSRPQRSCESTNAVSATTAAAIRRNDDRTSELRAHGVERRRQMRMRRAAAEAGNMQRCSGGVKCDSVWTVTVNFASYPVLWHLTTWWPPWCISIVRILSVVVKFEWLLPRDAMRKRGLCCRPVSVAPCGLRGCRNWPAPFLGRMSYKATKPGLVSVLYLSMRYNYGIVVY